MNDIFKKAGRRVARFFLTIVAFSIVMLAFLQITLIAGFAWLNTGKGREIVETHINKISPDYTFSIGSLFYDPVRGINIYGFSWKDADGEILSIDRLSIGIAFEKIFARHLDLLITGEDIALKRLPTVNESPEYLKSASLESFTIPDVFFRRVSISRLAIDRIILESPVAGQAITLSPRIRADVFLHDKLELNASVRPHVILENPIPARLPEEIKISAAFSPEKQHFILKNMSVTSSDYALTAVGEGHFQEKGVLDFNIHGTYPDLVPLTNNNFKSLDFTANIEGDYNVPVFTMNGNLATSKLAEKGLKDILFSAIPNFTNENNETYIEISTLYKDEPISLSSKISYKKPYLEIQDIKGSAPKISISGDVHADLASTLATGDIIINVSDFSYYKDLAGIDVSGNMDASLAFLPADEKQAVNGEITIKDAKYDSMSLKIFFAKFLLDDISYPWPKNTNISLEGLSVSKDVSIANASAIIKSNDADSFILSLSGKGKLPQDFSFRGSSTLSNFEGAFPSARDMKLDVILGSSALSLNGSMTPEYADLKASTKNFKLFDLPISLPEAVSSVSATGDATIKGAPAKPLSTVDLTFNGLQTGSYQAPPFSLKARHEANEATVNISGNGKDVRVLDAHVKAPMTFGLYPFNFAFENTAPISGSIKADFEAGAIAGMALTPAQELSGRILADAILSGSISNPAINGNAVIQDARFEDGLNGIEIMDIQAKSSFDQNSFTLSSLSASDGETGKISGAGRIGLDGKNSNLNIAMKNFHLPKEGIADAHLDANILFKDAPNGYALSGDINILDMNIAIPERFQSSIPELNIVERKKDNSGHPAQSILVNIGITASNQIFVRGWGLNAEFEGDIRVTGTAKDPQFNGVFKSIRGRYEEFGKRFELAHANMRFQGSIPPSPYLDIEATTETDDLTAKVLFTGPVKEPVLKFASVPALPEDEVLSHILFGRNTANISPFQAVQLAQTLRRFSGHGGGGFDPLNMLRSATGLDDIRVDTNDAGETSVGVGKYLTDKVYLEFERGKAENSGAANLQIEMTPDISLETKVGQDAQAGGGIFWKHDY